MQEFASEMIQAIHLILSGDTALWAIVGLSLQVSILAVLCAAVMGFPLGAALAVGKFPGRSAVIVLVNALMGMPPVVVGLVVYLLLSNAGPFGVLGLLYSPSAMIIAQTILVTPVVAALCRQSIALLYEEYRDQLISLGLSPWQMVPVLLWEARYALMTAGLAGFGRAIAEVGAVMIVGGNINHVTRVMTTAIALETSKGNLSLALALGVILVLMALGVNAVVAVIGGRRREAMHV